MCVKGGGGGDEEIKNKGVDVKGIENGDDNDIDDNYVYILS